MALGTTGALKAAVRPVGWGWSMLQDPPRRALWCHLIPFAARDRKGAVVPRFWWATVGQRRRGRYKFRDLGLCKTTERAQSPVLHQSKTWATSVSSVCPSSCLASLLFRLGSAFDATSTSSILRPGLTPGYSCPLRLRPAITQC